MRTIVMVLRCCHTVHAFSTRLRSATCRSPGTPVLDFCARTCNMNSFLYFHASTPFHTLPNSLRAFTAPSLLLLRYYTPPPRCAVLDAADGYIFYLRDVGCSLRILRSALPATCAAFTPACGSLLPFTCRSHLLLRQVPLVAARTCHGFVSWVIPCYLVYINCHTGILLGRFATRLVPLYHTPLPSPPPSSIYLWAFLSSHAICSSSSFPFPLFFFPSLFTHWPYHLPSPPALPHAIHHCSPATHTHTALWPFETTFPTTYHILHTGGA